MCDEGEVYCWMNCLPAPTCDSDYLICYNDQHVECCSDYNDESGCENMDLSCHWECTSTSSTVSPVSTPSTVSSRASGSICSLNLVVVFCLFITKLTGV